MYLVYTYVHKIYRYVHVQDHLFGEEGRARMSRLKNCTYMVMVAHICLN